MNIFLLVLVAIVALLVGVAIGKGVGYSRGKMEVSHIPRREPPKRYVKPHFHCSGDVEALKHELRACGIERK